MRIYFADNDVVIQQMPVNPSAWRRPGSRAIFFIEEWNRVGELYNFTPNFISDNNGNQTVDFIDFDSEEGYLAYMIATYSIVF